MAQWEDDLRAVVEHRGHALLRHAHVLLDRAATTTVVTVDDDATPEPTDEPDADPALELTVDALVAAFRRGGAAGSGYGAGTHGSVRLVTDEDLDDLEESVRSAQERLAPGRPVTSLRPVGEPPTPDDAATDPLTARLPEVVARVQGARRRGRRRALVGGVAAVVVAAVAASAVTGWPWDRGTGPEPGPTTAAYAGACGTTLPGGPSLLPVTLDDQDPPDHTALNGRPWYADYFGDASGLTTDQRALVGTLTPEVVLARGGKVVGLGVSTGTEVVDSASGADSAQLVWPGLGDGPSSFGDAFGGAPDTNGPTTIGVRFASCDGGDVKPGDYRVYLYATTDDESAHVLSEGAPVTVLPATPTGYQPRWLAGSALACGETVDEFVNRITPYPFIGLNRRGVVVHDDGLSYPLKSPAGTTQTMFLPPRAAIAWVQHGKIVSVGPDERATKPTTVKPGKTVSLSARPWNTRDYCTPSGDGTPGSLAPGTYQVLGYARVLSADPESPDAWFVEGSGPTGVVVHLDGTATLH